MPNTGTRPSSFRIFVDGILDRLGVPGAIGQKNTVGLERQNVLGAGLRRDDLNAAPRLRQTIQDVALYSEIVGDDAESRFRPLPLTPPIGCRTCDRGRQVVPYHAAEGLCPLHEALRVQILRADDAAQRPARADVADDGARVDLGDTDDAVRLHILLERSPGTPVGRHRAEFAGDKTLDEGFARLVVLVVGPVIPDVGVGHDHDLAGIGRVSQDLLVSEHRRIENDFSRGLAHTSKGAAQERPAVFQRENSGHLV